MNGDKLSGQNDEVISPIDMEQIQKTTDPLLREYGQAGAITAAKIVKTVKGYVLVIEVAWKPGDLIVFNQRGKPRAWASMDRLLRYLEDVAPSVRHFDLVFDEPPGWEIFFKPKDAKPVAKTKEIRVRGKEDAG